LHVPDSAHAIFNLLPGEAGVAFFDLSLGFRLGLRALCPPNPDAHSTEDDKARQVSFREHVLFGILVLMSEHDETSVPRGGQAPSAAQGYDPLAPVSRRLVALLSEEENGEAEELVRWMSTRLRALKDLRMRRVVAEECLYALDDAGLLAMLHRVLIGARQGLSVHRELLDVLTLDPGVLTELDYARISDLYNAAHRADLEDVTRLLLRQQRSDTTTVASADLDNEHLALPTGVRRKIAKGSDRDLLDRALRDRNPLVIRDVLDNPRLVESDVVRLAAARPTTQVILGLLADHRKWSLRYRVRLALACNPYTAEPIAERLIATLMAQDLGLVINGAGISEARKQAARKRREQMRRDRSGDA